jgi:hypothetical protein
MVIFNRLKLDLINNNLNILGFLNHISLLFSLRETKIKNT